MLSDYVIECLHCGYMSSEIEDFIKMIDGALCHTCYDENIKDLDMLVQDKELYKSEALTYAINTDYFE